MNDEAVTIKLAQVLWTTTVALLVVGCATPSTPSPFPVSTASPTPTPTPAPTEERHELTGTFILDQTDGVLDLDGDSCAGRGGYDDIRGSLPVLVKNEAEVTIGSSNTSPGRFEGIAHPDFPELGSGLCVFAFTVHGVPVAAFYSVEVGGRGEVTYSYPDLVASGWKVAITLGT